MVRSRYARGTVEVRSWYGPGAVEVLSWCGGGTLVVRSRYARGAVEVARGALPFTLLTFQRVILYVLYIDSDM